MAVSKPLLTEFVIHHRLESCARLLKTHFSGLSEHWKAQGPPYWTPLCGSDPTWCLVSVCVHCQPRADCVGHCGVQDQYFGPQQRRDLLRGRPQAEEGGIQRDTGGVSWVIPGHQQQGQGRDLFLQVWPEPVRCSEGQAEAARGLQGGQVLGRPQRKKLLRPSGKKNIEFKLHSISVIRVNPNLLD